MADIGTETAGGKGGNGKGVQKKRMDYFILKGRLSEVRRTLKSAITDKTDLETKVNALGAELGIKPTGKGSAKA